MRAYAQIKLLEPSSDPRRWTVLWTWGGDKEATDFAQVTAYGLQRRLVANPEKYRGRIIVGDVRYALSDGPTGRSGVEIPVVHYITGDVLSHLLFVLRRPFMG